MRASQLSAQAWQVNVISGLIRATSFAAVEQTSPQSTQRCIALA